MCEWVRGAYEEGVCYYHEANPAVEQRPYEPDTIRVSEPQKPTSPERLVYIMHPALIACGVGNMTGLQMFLANETEEHREKWPEITLEEYLRAYSIVIDSDSQCLCILIDGKDIPISHRFDHGRHMRCSVELPANDAHAEKVKSHLFAVMWPMQLDNDDQLLTPLQHQPPYDPSVKYVEIFFRDLRGRIIPVNTTKDTQHPDTYALQTMIAACLLEAEMKAQDERTKRRA